MWLECDCNFFFPPDFLYCVLLFCGVPCFVCLFVLFLFSCGVSHILDKVAVISRRKASFAAVCYHFGALCRQTCRSGSFFLLLFGLFCFVKAMLMVQMISVQLLSFTTNRKLTAVLLVHRFFYSKELITSLGETRINFSAGGEG